MRQESASEDGTQETRHDVASMKRVFKLTNGFYLEQIVALAQVIKLAVQTMQEVRDLCWRKGAGNFRVPNNVTKSIVCVEKSVSFELCENIYGLQTVRSALPKVYSDTIMTLWFHVSAFAESIGNMLGKKLRE